MLVVIERSRSLLPTAALGVLALLCGPALSGSCFQDAGWGGSLGPCLGSGFRPRVALGIAPKGLHDGFVGGQAQGVEVPEKGTSQLSIRATGSGPAGNGYIVGINQIYDVSIARPSATGNGGSHGAAYSRAAPQPPPFELRGKVCLEAKAVNKRCTEYRRYFRLLTC